VGEFVQYIALNRLEIPETSNRRLSLRPVLETEAGWVFVEVVPMQDLAALGNLIGELADALTPALIAIHVEDSDYAYVTGRGAELEEWALLINPELAGGLPKRRLGAGGLHQ
jgi:hypothetical protein